MWVEEHDVREAQDRRVRRLMEGENKKLRDKAKKERNEEIRVSSSSSESMQLKINDVSS